MYKKFNNPKAIFFAIIFHHILKEPVNNLLSFKLNVECFDHFMQQDRSFALGNNIINPVKFLIQNVDYISNDFLTENDFNLYRDILLYYSPIQINSYTFSGFMFDIENGLCFRYKNSNMTQEKLIELSFLVLDHMKLYSKLFKNQDLKYLYTDRINVLYKQYALQSK